MGFTRYWMRQKEFDKERFSAFAQACKDYCVSLDFGLSGMTFTDDLVQFDAEPGCEPFVIKRVSQGRERDNQIMEYCKTQHLPYDKAVQHCLEVLQSHFPEVTIPPAS